MRSPLRRITLTVTLAVALLLPAAAAQQRPCDGCLAAKYWTIPPDDFEQTTTDSNSPSFPEAGIITGDDLGIAFSGGGTRSATATLGQLRGLQANGWLSHVRYVSAASGGAWASIVFTYSKRPLTELLGADQPPGSLDVDTLTKAPNGRLAKAIADSSLTAGSVLEAAAIAAELAKTNTSANIAPYVSSLLNLFRREPGRLDKTYARLLGKVFLDDVIEAGEKVSDRWFTWDGAAAADIGAATGGQIGHFVLAASPRPFLIVGGTMVSARRDYAFPLLIPVEYTPLYIGARQRFGEFGGSYVSPWAYDAEAAGPATRSANGSGTVEVKLRDSEKLTLADMAASTGAAPALATIVGVATQDKRARKLLDQIHRGTAFFPAFQHLSVQDGGRVSLTTSLAHADGGAIDNLGIMPLLARQVHNILVFVNTSTRYAEDNDDLQSLFLPAGPPGAGGDKRFNVVFPASAYQALLDDLARFRDSGEPQVACRTMAVLKNPIYNIRGYQGANVCFVYNGPATRWEQALKDPVRTLLHNKSHATGDLRNFPWFDTFEQNKPQLIQLKPAQVNLLSNLTAWIMTDPATARTITRVISVLPPR